MGKLLEALDLRRTETDNDRQEAYTERLGSLKRLAERRHLTLSGDLAERLESIEKLFGNPQEIDTAAIALKSLEEELDVEFERLVERQNSVTIHHKKVSKQAKSDAEIYSKVAERLDRIGGIIIDGTSNLEVLATAENELNKLGIRVRDLQNLRDLKRMADDRGLTLNGRLDEELQSIESLSEREDVHERVKKLAYDVGQAAQERGEYEAAYLLLGKNNLKEAIAICNNPPRTLVPGVVKEFNAAHRSFLDSRSAGEFKVETIDRLKVAFDNLIEANTRFKSGPTEFKKQMATVTGYETAKKLAEAKSSGVASEIKKFNEADGKVRAYSDVEDWDNAIRLVDPVLKKAADDLIKTYNDLHNKDGGYKKKCNEKMQKIIKMFDYARDFANTPTSHINKLSADVDTQLKDIKNLLWERDDIAGFEVGVEKLETDLVELKKLKLEYKNYANKLMGADESLTKTLNKKDLPGNTKKALEAIRANIVKLADHGDMTEANRLVDVLRDQAKAAGRN